MDVHAAAQSPRVTSSQGLDAAYYFVNNCVAFDPPDFMPAADEDDFDYSLGAG